MRRVALVVALIVLVSPAMQAARVCGCSICGSAQSRTTLRNEQKQANIVVFGKLANARFNQGPNAKPGAGTTDLHILKVLKDHPALGKQQVVEINSFIPIPDKSNPPLWVLFLRVENGKATPYFGRPAESPALLTYLNGIDQLGGEPPALPRLKFFYEYLDHPDNDIATDAFLEFAKAPDKDLAEVATMLNPAKFRKLLLDPKTATEKIGMFAFLLSSSRDPKDADLLRGMIEKPTIRTRAALDGLLCGLIQLQPDAGWKTVYGILGKGKTFDDRYAAFRVVRFYYNCRPKEYHDQILHSLDVMLAGNMADLAIDALRGWAVWDRTPSILGLYGKPGYTAPIIKRSILRYAVTCPLAQAKNFVEAVRQKEPALIQEIEQDLQEEKKLNATSPS
jgi:hypothetical protein